MWFAKIAGGTHQEKLESFYKAQADLYDSYRFRMLHGRLPMIRKMPTPAKGVWLDIRGGTGSNLEYFGPPLPAEVPVLCLHWPGLFECEVLRYLFSTRGSRSGRI
jgi:hypothetical protein